MNPYCADGADYRAAFFRVLERCEELKAQVGEHQWNALEMARKADAAERRAEEAEFHVEQLRDARDRAEVLAENIANDAALVRLAQAEALRTAGRAFVDEMADTWGGDSQWLTTGTRVAEVVGAVLREMASDLEGECDHHWLDRPESDTRECLICGLEAAG